MNAIYFIKQLWIYHLNFSVKYLSLESFRFQDFVHYILEINIPINLIYYNFLYQHFSPINILT